MTRTQHLHLNETTPYHYTTEADYVTWGKSLQFNAFSMKRRVLFKDNRAALTELFTVKNKM